MKQWENSSNYSFTDFAKNGDEIDSEIYFYFLEVLPPIYHKNGVFQVSEPYSHIEGKPTYQTFQKIGSKYYYLGILTENRAEQLAKL